LDVSTLKHDSVDWNSVTSTNANKLPPVFIVPPPHVPYEVERNLRSIGQSVLVSGSHLEPITGDDDVDDDDDDYYYTIT
jgi:hypothetical protein